MRDYPARHLLRLASCAFLAAATRPLPAPAATLRVPSEYATLQAGLDAAAGGDVVLVAPGVYAGPGNRELDFGGKALALRSEGGAAVTAIDCGGIAVGVRFAAGEGPEAVLDGFTVRAGASPSGGAVACTGASPSVVNCVFVQNAGSSGGAVSCELYSSPAFENCTFAANTSAGGAIACRSFSFPTIIRCLVVLNLGGPSVTCDESSEAFIACSDVFGNEGGDWVGCIASQQERDGNLALDPLFCDRRRGDYALQSGSPCLPGQHPHGAPCGLMGALGEGCEATRTQPASWGTARTRIR